MSISALLGFLSLAGWIMVVAGGGIAISNASRNQSMRPGILLALAGIVVGILFFMFSSGVVQVAPDEVAVVFKQVGGDPTQNSLDPNPLGPGVHIIIPVINVPTIYSTRVQTYTMSKTANEGTVTGDDSVQARTKDGQQVYIDISVLYHVSTADANLVHIRWQNRYEADFVRPTVRAAVREVISAYAVEDAYGEKRTEIQAKVRDLVTPKFKDNGLILSDLLLRNITFSDEYIKAVEQKQVAQQDAQRAIQEADRVRTQAKGQADAAVLTAKGESDALAQRAQGEASAILTRAKAEADALGLVNEQITKNPLLIQYTYIQKLASDVKLVLLPSNTPFLFDPQTLVNQAGTGGSSGGNSPVPPTPAPGAVPGQPTPAPAK